MSIPKHNVPCFAPPVNYRYKIDPNVAWVRSAPSPPPPPSPPSPPSAPIATGQSSPPLTDSPSVTPWGTPVPLWRANDRVLVQLHPPSGEWYHATVVEVLVPIEVDNLSKEEINKIPPVRIVSRDKRAHILTVKPNFSHIEERFLVPVCLEGALIDNVVKFEMNERVLVRLSNGEKTHTHEGYISYVFGDKIIRDKHMWHVVPRLYQVYIDELATSGCWTAESIIKVGSQSPEEANILPAPLLIVPSQDYETWLMEQS
ncbi:hypothetical protein RHS04_07291 [Rhizoctonia solani]|uniref:Uncharacterized protein n=1 Tax=Rhizoctonia solani TaxID=456999 RepID=A0A8H7H1P4_9AGAM|nr:hypothetical protein RHS04_07291 [Rhizoctonia solani]